MFNWVRSQDIVSLVADKIPPLMTATVSKDFLTFLVHDVAENVVSFLKNIFKYNLENDLLSS